MTERMLELQESARADRVRQKLQRLARENVGNPATAMLTSVLACLSDRDLIAMANMLREIAE